MRHVFQAIAVFGSNGAVKIISERDTEEEAREDITASLKNYGDLMSTVTLSIKEIWTNSAPKK